MTNLGPVGDAGASASKLRIGVLGAGPIAQFAHLEACRKARNVELYAICDRATDLLARVAAVHPPQRTFADYDEMLADPEVDAVIIATADQFHVDAARRALDAGKHVLVEKPLGVDVAECEVLSENVHASGLILQVGNMKRFDEGIAHARDFISGEIGELIALKAWYCDSAYRYTMTDSLQPLVATSEFVARPSRDPKADRRRYLMLTHGSHLIDTARYLAGDITAVTARYVERADARSWFALLELGNGAIGHLDLTMNVRMDWHEGFSVYGTEGSVIGKTFLPWYFRSSEVECFSSDDRTYRRPLGEDSHFFRRQVEHFAECVLEGTPMRGASVDDGLAALRAMDAIEQSANSGERVELPTTISTRR
jgi:predicted dehydrogenase